MSFIRAFVKSQPKKELARKVKPFRQGNSTSSSNFSNQSSSSGGGPHLTNYFIFQLTNSSISPSPAFQLLIVSHIYSKKSNSFYNFFGPSRGFIFLLTNFYFTFNIQKGGLAGTLTLHYFSNQDRF